MPLPADLPSGRAGTRRGAAEPDPRKPRRTRDERDCGSAMMLVPSRLDRAVTASQRTADPAQGADLRLEMQAAYSQVSQRRARRAEKGLQHVNNDIVVDNAASECGRAAPLRSASGILKHCGTPLR